MVQDEAPQVFWWWVVCHTHEISSLCDLFQVSTNEWKQIQHNRWLKNCDQSENTELWKEICEFWEGSLRNTDKSLKALYNCIMAVCDAFALSVSLSCWYIGMVSQFVLQCQSYSCLDDIYVGGFVLYTGTAEVGQQAVGVFAGSPLLLDIVNKKQADIKELVDYLTTDNTVCLLLITWALYSLLCLAIMIPVTIISNIIHDTILLYLVIIVHLPLSTHLITVTIVSPDLPSNNSMHIGGSLPPLLVHHDILSRLRCIQQKKKKKRRRRMVYMIVITTMITEQLCDEYCLFVLLPNIIYDWMNCLVTWFEWSTSFSPTMYWLDSQNIGNCWWDFWWVREFPLWTCLAI
jgi:hypothetical protein